MVDMLHEYGDAVIANDGAAVVEMFVSTGTWTGELGPDVGIADGTLEAAVNEFPWTPPFFMEPILVDGNRLLYVHEYQGSTFSDTVTFTESGDLMIVNHRWMS